MSVVGIKKRAQAVITIAMAMAEWLFGSMVFWNSIITIYSIFHFWFIFLIFAVRSITFNLLPFYKNNLSLFNGPAEEKVE